MQTTVLNPKNSWKYWSEADVQLLKQSNVNTNVGEKLVFENEEVKVWTIHLQPNDTLPFHKHNKNYIWTALTEGKAISYFNDGSVTETIYEI